MKLREKLKRFWTLDVHNHEGFTLVELIIVIAILAILSTGAIAGYSVYIKQANMTADKALIAEITNVLTLAGYSGELGNEGGGYLILTATGDLEGVEAGSDLEKVLKAAFGDNYKSVLKLKYNEWGNNGLVLGLAGGQAYEVYHSTYYAVSDKLMGQVTEITKAAWSILKGVSGEANRDEMISMFAGGSMTLEDAAKTYGYNSLADVPDDALPNLMVLAVAGDVTMENTAENPDDWTMSEASSLIQSFALYNGYASTTAGQATNKNGTSFADAYATFVDEISVANDVTEVAAAYKKLQAVAKEDSGYNDYITNQQSKTDINAFTAMMSGLTGAAAMNNSGVTEGLGQADFFTAGLGKDLFDTYIGSVESVLGLGDDADAALLDVFENGGVAIYYSVDGSVIYIGNSLPLN